MDLNRSALIAMGLCMLITACQPDRLGPFDPSDAPDWLGADGWSSRTYTLTEQELGIDTALTACSTGGTDVGTISAGMLAWPDWSTKTYWCIEPGDYTPEGAWGTVPPPVLDVDGTAASPKYLVYYNPAIGPSVHPVDIPELDRARTTRIEIEADHWIIDRLDDAYWHGSRPNVIVAPQSTDVTLNRLMVRGLNPANPEDG